MAILGHRFNFNFNKAFIFLYIFFWKIDVAAAKPDQVIRQMEKVFDVQKKDIIMVSWRYVLQWRRKTKKFSLKNITLLHYVLCRFQLKKDGV